MRLPWKVALQLHQMLGQPRKVTCQHHCNFSKCCPCQAPATKTHTTTSPNAATATRKNTLYYSLLFSNSLLYSTILYSTLLYSPLLYSTLLCTYTHVYIYIHIYSPWKEAFCPKRKVIIPLFFRGYTYNLEGSSGIAFPILPKFEGEKK